MALVFADRVKETSTTTGTGSYTLAGAATGYRTVDSGVGSGNTAYFCAEDGTDWEVFLGTFLEGSLARTTILASSNAGAAVNWGAGTKNIFVVVPALALQRMTPSPTIAADHDFNGCFFTAVAGENLAIGDDCYLKSDGKFWKADASDGAKNGMHVMATGSISTDASGVFLKTGFIRDDSWAWTIGSTLYTPSTPGNPSENYPAAGHAGGGYGKRIAYSVSADVLCYCPGMEYSDIAAARGLFGGGQTTVNVNIIDCVTIASTGNGTYFGDLTAARRALAACSSAIRGLFGGGYDGTNNFNVIDYVTIATTGNAANFGNLTAARRVLTGCSSITRGLFAGGYTTINSDIIDYVTFVSTGNAVDFGNLTAARIFLAGCSSSTRGLFGGGFTTVNFNIIDYVAIATTGNATDFGDLTEEKYDIASCSSSTRGLFAGGYTTLNINVIDYVTIATTGNAADFGDLTVIRKTLSACSSAIRGLFGGGYNGTNNFNVIDYVTIATTGNAVDFGDLTATLRAQAGCSNGHGGLF